jgi:hypothetical protein
MLSFPLLLLLVVAIPQALAVIGNLVQSLKSIISAGGQVLRT